MTADAMPAVAHEDPEMLALMATPVAGQAATLETWGWPGVGLLHLLSSCHGGCFFCSNRTLVEMPAELVTTGTTVEARLAGLETLGLDLLCIGGTEPTTHPRFEEVLARCAAAGIATEIMTSGLSLAVPGEAARWRDLGVARVAVPLYGPVPGLHDAIVERPGQHARVVAGLDHARAAGIDVAVHTLALRRTLGGLAPLARQVHARWGSTLAVAPLRRKDDLFRYEDEAPSWRELASAVGDAPVELVGFPACAATDLARGGAAVIALYFRTQRLVHAAPCVGCDARHRCRGVVPAHLEAYGEGELTPWSAGSESPP